MNCIKIGLPGKLILRDYLHENMTSQRPFFLLRIRFPGRPIFYTIASSPMGPFKLLSLPFKLFGAEIGGATAYADPAAPSDAFFIYSQKPGVGNNQTRTMTVAKLTQDWRNVSAITATFPGHLEGPAMFFNQREGLYYMWTSHTRGWNGSPAVVHSSSTMAGSEWKQG